MIRASGPEDHAPSPQLLLYIREMAHAYEVSFFDAVILGMESGHFILDPNRVPLYGAQ